VDDEQMEDRTSVNGSNTVCNSTHVACFWNSQEEFAEAVGLLETGLRGTDHAVVLGHDQANRSIRRILEEHGLDTETLIAAGRFTVLTGGADSDAMLGAISATFQRAIAGGASMIRLVTNLGWGHAGWPDETSLLAFEARLTQVAKQFPCVVACLYDVASLSGIVVRHGGFESHPQVFRAGQARDNPDYVPADIFLRQLTAVAAKLVERHHAEDTLHHITEGVANATGEEFFRSLARHLADAMRVRYAFVTECADKAQTRVRALAYWDGIGFADDVEYALHGTPCQKVIEGDICSYPERLQLLFPEDKPLATMGAESFAGVPLPDSNGKVLGHLVVMDTRPRVFDDAELRILRIFATRAGAELQRIRADREVQSRNLELGMLLDINRAIGHHLERDQLFGALAGCLRTLVPTDRFGIELPIAGERLQGHILSAFASEGSRTEPTVLPAAGTACNWVLQQRQWYVAGRVDEFRERFPITFDVMSEQGMESLCALPLVSGERTQ